jgi:hypothetical protein
MEAVKMPVNPGSSTLFFMIAGIAALWVGYVAYRMIQNNKTIGSGNWEGFQGPPLGVSDIPCGQESSYAAQLSALFSAKKSTTEEGEADLKEFKTIVSKLCCFKHDLMSTNQVVRATLRVPFNTSHDRENLGDTTGRCFTKSMPPRELDIIFDTWKTRGLHLLDRLCTSYNLTPFESAQADKAFASVLLDTLDVAKTVCVSSQMEAAKGSPRDLRGYMPESIKNLGAYLGYY